MDGISSFLFRICSEGLVTLYKALDRQIEINTSLNASLLSIDKN